MYPLNRNANTHPHWINRLLQDTDEAIGVKMGSVNPPAMERSDCSIFSIQLTIGFVILSSDLGSVGSKSFRPILYTIASLTKQIRAYGRKVGTRYRQRYPETKLLRPVSGVDQRHHIITSMFLGNHELDSSSFSQGISISRIMQLLTSH
jgi:hypothetical protein